MECSAGSDPAEPLALRPARFQSAGTVAPAAGRITRAPAQVTRRRRKCRLPTCRTRPSSASAGTSRASTAPRRRAARRPGRACGARPSASARTPSAITAGRCTVPFSAGTSASSISAGSSCAMNSGRSAASASAAAARGVEPRHERAREGALGVARARARRRLLPQQQREPRRDLLVRDPQRLAVHLAGRLGHADVVAERLRHLLHAVDAGEQRHREDDLRRLPVGLLDRAAHVAG